MAGVAIDVEAKTGSVESELANLNRQLINLVKNSKRTKTGIESIDLADTKKVGKGLKENVIAMRKLGDTSKKAFVDTRKSADGVNKALSRVKHSILQVGSALLVIKGLSAFQQTADNLISVQNVLKLVIKDTDKLYSVQRKVYTLARSTRSSFSSTANIYQDFTKSLAKEGVVQKNILRVVSTIQKSAALSGGDDASRNAALRQLSQGLSSGVLRGEELNAVLEQMRYLGQGLAEQLGKSTGELRKFAADGKLTTKVLYDAVIGMEKATDIAFKSAGVTFGTAAGQVSAALGQMFGSLNQQVGITTGFTRQLTKLATGLDKFSDKLQDKVSIIRSSIINFINNLDFFNSYPLTLKAVMTFDISPLDAYEKYKFFRLAKKTADTVRGLFGIEFSKPGTFGSIQLPAIKSSGKDLRTFKVVFLELKDAAKEALEGIKITFSELVRIIPLLKFPVRTVVTDFKVALKSVVADADAFAFDLIAPIARSLEGSGELLRLFSQGDKRLDRSYVNLFKSTSIKEFTENLKKVNAARQKIKLDDHAFVGREYIRSIEQAIYSVEDFGIELGLIENRLLRIRDTRFDRLIKEFKYTGDVIRRVYTDVFATTLEPIFKKLMYEMEGYGTALIDAFINTMDHKAAETSARRVGDALSSVVYNVFKLQGELESGNISLIDIVDPAGFTGKLKPAADAAYDFMKVFAKGLYHRVISEVPDDFVKLLIDKLFSSAKAGIKASLDILKDAFNTIESYDYTAKIDLDADTSKLEVAYQRVLEFVSKIYTYAKAGFLRIAAVVQAFGSRVKAVFYDVYDDVVGHSSWPDTIDGVVSHTKRLSIADKNITIFINSIKAKFSRLAKDVGSAAVGLKGAFGDFFRQVAQIDTDTLLYKLQKNLGAALLAVIGIVTGNATIRGGSVAFIATFLNYIFNDAFSSFAPTVSTGLAESGAILAKGMVVGFAAQFKLVLELIPDFIRSFAVEMSPLPAEVSKTMGMFMEQIPILDLLFNDLLLTVVGLGTAWGVFAKKGWKTIGKIIFGKSPKAGKDKTDFGIVDYLPGMAGVASNKKPLLKSNKLGMLSGIAFSAAFLKNISIVEAAAVGVPLAVFAGFGKSAGSIFLTDFGDALFDGSIVLFRKFQKEVAKQAAARFGADSLVSKLVTPSTKVPKKTTGPIVQGVKNLGSALFGAYRDIQDSAEDYGKGEIGLFEAAFPKPKKGFMGPAMPRNTISNAAGELKKELIKAYGPAISGAWRVLKSSGRATINWIKATVHNSNILTSFVDLSKKIFEALKDINIGAFKLITKGVLSVLKLIKNPLVLGVVASFYALKATAASDASSAISDLADSGKPLAILVGSLLAVGAAMKTIETYNFGKEAFILKSQAPNQVRKAYAIDKTLQLASYDKSGTGTTKGRAKLITALDLEAEKAIKTSIKNLEGLTTAGWTKVWEGFAKAGSTAWAIVAGSAKVAIAVLKGVLSPLDGMVTLFRYITKSDGKLLKQSLFDLKNFIYLNKKAKTSALTLAESVIRSQSETGYKLGFAEIGAKFLIGIENAFKGGKRAFFRFTGALLDGWTGLITGLRSASVGLAQAFLVVFPKVQKAVDLIQEKGIAATGAILKGLMSIKALKWAVNIGIWGTVGLWLFGPGDGLRENLSWIYDKLRSIIGLDAATDFGRMQNIRDNLRPRDIGPIKVDFTESLDSVDIGDLTEDGYKTLLSASSEVSTAMNDLAMVYLKEGRITSKSQSDLKAIQKGMRDILSRQSQRVKGTYEEEQTRLLTGLNRTLSGIGLVRDVFNPDPTIVPVGSPGKHGDFREMFSEYVDKQPAPIDLFRDKNGYYTPPEGTDLSTLMALETGLAFEHPRGGFLNETSYLIDSFTELIGFQRRSALHPLSQQGFNAHKFEAVFSKAAKSFFPDPVGSFGNIVTVPVTAALEAVGYGKLPELDSINADLSPYLEGLDAVWEDVPEYLKVNAGAIDKGLRRQAEIVKAQAKGFDLNAQFGKKHKRNIDLEYSINRAKLAGFKEQKKQNLIAMKLEGTKLQLRRKANAEDIEIAERVKTYLDIDLGKNLEKFPGTVAEKSELSARTGLAHSLEGSIETSFGDERVAHQASLDQLKANTNKFTDQVAAAFTVKGSLDIVTRVLDGEASKAMLADLQVSNIDLFKTVLKLSRSAEAAQQQLNDLPLDDPKYAEFEKRVKRINKELVKVLPPSSWVFQIDAVFSQLGLKELGNDVSDLFDLASKKARAGTAEAIKNSDLNLEQIRQRKQPVQPVSPIAAQAIDYSVAEDDLFGLNRFLAELKPEAGITKSMNFREEQSKDYNAELRRNTQLRYNADIDTDSQIASKVFKEIKGISDPHEQYQRYTERTGIKAPDNLLALPDSLKQWTEATSELAVITSNLQGNFTSSDAAYAAVLRDVVKDAESAVGKGNLEDRLSGAKISTDRTALSLAPSGIKDSLLKQSDILDAVARQKEKLTTLDIASGKALALDVIKTQALYVINRDLLKIQTLSGTGLAEVVSSAGLNDPNIAKGLTIANVEFVKMLDYRAKLANLAASETNDTQTAIGYYKEEAKWLKIKETYVSRLGRTFQDSLDDINSVFFNSTSDITALELAELPPGMGDELGKLADTFKQRMEEGTTNDLGFFKQLRKATRVGEAVAFFRDIQKQMQKAVSGGLQDGYASINSLGVGLSEKGYSRLSSDSRQELTLEGTARSLLLKATNLPDRTSGMAEVLNKIGTEPSVKLLEDFKRVTGEDVMQDLSELNNPVVKSINDSADKIVGAILDPKAAIAAAVERSKKDVAAKKAKLESGGSPEPDIRPNALMAGILDRFNTKPEDLDKAFKIDSNISQGLKTAAYSEIVKANLNNIQVAQMTKKAHVDYQALAKSTAYARVALDQAVTDGNYSEKLSLELLELERQLRRAPEIFEATNKLIMEGGEKFAGDTRGAFKSAVSGLLKGEADEGMSVIQTFFVRMGEQILDSMVDSLAEGMTSALFDNKAVDDMLNQMGQGLVGLVPGLAGKAVGGPGTAMREYAGEGMLSATAGYDSLLEGKGLSGAVGGDIVSKMQDTEALSAVSGGAEAVDGVTGAGDISEAGMFDGLGDSIIDGLGSMIDSVSTFLTEDFMTLIGDIGGAIMSGLSSIGGFSHGGLVRAATGGLIAGPGTGTSDSIPAMLSNREFIVNAKSTKANLGLLRYINSGEKIPAFAAGGSVGAVNMAAVTAVPAAEGNKIGTNQVVNLNITGDISRQTKAEIYRMLPQIASGVNIHNKDTGFKYA